jgi:hypothetical protein
MFEAEQQQLEAKIRAFAPKMTCPNQPDSGAGFHSAGSGASAPLSSSWQR